MPRHTKRTKLVDLIATQQHHNIMDEGGTISGFKLGLRGYSMKRLKMISKDGF
jgi:hypothetical protein